MSADYLPIGPSVAVGIQTERLLSPAGGVTEVVLGEGLYRPTLEAGRIFPEE